jgi:hypothetical protein
MWSDGTYVYIAQGSNGSLTAYTFNGVAWTLKGTYATTGKAYALWGDGTYIYLAEGTAGVRALTFNGTTFTNKGIYNTAGTATDVWGDGTYIYVADGASGVVKLTFNGTTWSLVTSYGTKPASSIWGMGSYIYALNNTSVMAFNSSLTNLAEFTLDNTPGSLWSDGTYLYAVDNSNATVSLYALSFNGTTFTQAGKYSILGGFMSSVSGANGYIYASSQSNTRSFTFNGSTFSLKGFFPHGSAALRAAGSYVFIEQYGYTACSP